MCVQNFTDAQKVVLIRHSHEQILIYRVYTVLPYGSFLARRHLGLTEKWSWWLKTYGSLKHRGGLNSKGDWFLSSYSVPWPSPTFADFTSIEPHFILVCFKWVLLLLLWASQYFTVHYINTLDPHLKQQPNCIHWNREHKVSVTGNVFQNSVYSLLRHGWNKSAETI